MCATEGILQILDEREMRAVLGHELSHVYNRDILISSVAGRLGSLHHLHRATSRSSSAAADDRDSNPFAAILMLILGPLAAGLIQLAISRSREYQADASGAELQQRPAGAGFSALHKLEVGVAAQPLAQSPSLVTTSHMMIANPFRGRAWATCSRPTRRWTQRIARLQKMAESDPRFWR